MAGSSNIRSDKVTLRHKFQNFSNFFFKTLQSFVSFGKYCQSLGLRNILLRFYNITSQIFYLLMVRQYFFCCLISISLTNFDVGWCLLHSNKSFRITQGNSKTQNCFKKCLLNLFFFKWIIRVW